MVDMEVLRKSSNFTATGRFFSQILHRSVASRANFKVEQWQSSDRQNGPPSICLPGYRAAGGRWHLTWKAAAWRYLHIVQSELGRGQEILKVPPMPPHRMVAVEFVIVA